MRSFLSCCLLLFPLAAGAQAPAASRGELLYSTHCIECHTVQMHWRALRLARDWNSLKAQVWRWQGEARLNWTEEEVDAVTRHLNDTIYQFPRPLALRPQAEGTGMNVQASRASTSTAVARLAPLRER